MAFAFFRRRQKMVIIIMAVLMVCFVIGAQGFRMLTEKRPEDRVVGTTNMGRLKAGEIARANNDIRLLSMYIRLGDVKRIATTGWPMDVEFLRLASARDAGFAYALLLAEALEAGHRTVSSEIDNFFSQIGMPQGSEGYRMVTSLMKSRHDGTGKHLRAAVGRWLTIHKSFVASRVQTPPSEQELRRLYRDLNEKIGLRVVKISTEDFLADVPAPGEDETEQQFEQASQTQPGEYSDVASFGFGYRQPDRVRLGYLLAGRDAVSRATRPSDKKARDHFRANRDKYLNRATPTTQPETAPAKRPTEFSDFKDEIMAELQADAVERKMEEVLSRAETLLAEYDQKGIEARNAYQWVRDAMTISADEALGRKLEVVEINNERLDRAMEILARSAGLQAICYPYDVAGDSRLDPAVRVSLSARDTTLADALKEVDRQVKSPGVKWAMCDSLEDVIFPVDDSGLQPITVGQVGPVARGEPFADEVLEYCATASGQRLSELAFLVEDFAAANRSASLVKVNQDGPRMVVGGPLGGMLLWRVIEAVPAYTPESLSGRDDLKEQVIRDVKTAKAFQLAVAKAEQLLAAARKDGLAAAAEAAGLEAVTTGLFSRKVFISPQKQIGMLAMMRGQSQEQAIAQAVISKPVEFLWTDVPGIALPTHQLRQYLVAEAFALVPDDLEPAAGDEPYPQEPYALAIINLPARREVLVAQRVDYSPAVIGEYEGTGRQAIYQALAALHNWQMLATWFRATDIAKRVNFQLKESQETPRE